MPTSDTQQDQNNTACHPEHHRQKKGEKHGTGLWGNPRVKKSYRVDEGIHNASKPVKIRYFGSICRANEMFDIALIAMDQALKQQVEEAVPHGVTSINMTNYIVREMQPHRKLKVGEILPVEHGLNEAVDRAYVEFRGGRHFPSREDVTEFVRVECGVTGLDNKAVTEKVLGMLREDRRK